MMSLLILVVLCSLIAAREAQWVNQQAPFQAQRVVHFKQDLSSKAENPLLLHQALRKAFYGLLTKQPLTKLSDNWGHVTSCGPPDANFTVMWEPKVIDPEGHINVTYNYTIPHDFDGGTVDVALYFNKIENPIFKDTFPVKDCTEVRKYLPCPLKAGIRLQGWYPYSNLLILKGYDGTYKAKVQVSNKQKQIMFCAIAVVTIKGRES